MRASQTERARMALRRRAYQRGLVQKTDQQRATLQELVRLLLKSTNMRTGIVD